MDSSANILAPVAAARFAPQHHETQERSLRCPSPPKVWIPPPQINEHGAPDLAFVTDNRDSYLRNGMQNADFLASVDYSSIFGRDVGRDWRYEERRKAQEILPFLFLGPDVAARDRTFLVEEGITMCMAVRDKLTAQANLLRPKAPRDLGIPLVNVDVMGNSQLISEFPRAIGTINDHLNARFVDFRASNPASPPPSPPGKVLIFCETGNERSAAVAAAYVMAMYSVDVARAVQLVQGSRFCVALDYHMGHLLSSFQAILEAKRDVYKAVTPEPGARYSSPNVAPKPPSFPNITTAGSVTTNKKRGFEATRDEDEDDEMEDAGGGFGADADRFANRESLAPFADGVAFAGPSG